MVFLQRFRCTTEPIGGGTEQDEEGELVSWEAAVAAIEIAMKQFGWHPASELPEKPTSKLGRVVILTLDGKLKFNYYVGGWDMSNTKWWRYPPKED